MINEKCTIIIANIINISLLPKFLIRDHYFDSQNLVANVSDQFKNQFVIETILIINLETDYNFLELF